MRSRSVEPDVVRQRARGFGAHPRVASHRSHSLHLGIKAGNPPLRIFFVSFDVLCAVFLFFCTFSLVFILTNKIRSISNVFGEIFFDILFFVFEKYAQFFSSLVFFLDFPSG